MQLEKIRARIQKLLAMAQDSSSPHEAAIGAERIQKLMAKFNLDMADVIAKELQDEDNLVHVDREFQYKRIPAHIQWIEVTIAHAFNCEVQRRYKNRNGIDYDVTEIFGYKTDVEVVKSLCTYICGQLDVMAKRVKVPENYRRFDYARRYMADWRKGAAKEICDRIESFYGSGEVTENRAANASIVGSQSALATLKKDAIRRKFGQFRYSTSTTKYYTHDGLAAGGQAASAIDINRKISGNTQALPFLN
jgi:hypothetical protein